MIIRASNLENNLKIAVSIHYIHRCYGRGAFKILLNSARTAILEDTKKAKRTANILDICFQAVTAAASFGQSRGKTKNSSLLSRFFLSPKEIAKFEW